MHSEFSMLAKSARAAIAVPDVPFDNIVSRSRALGYRARLRTVVACGALALAAVAGGTVGPKVYDGIQFWFSGGRWAAVMHSFASMNPPSPSDLRGVTARATFPVVYPVGLPDGTHLIRVICAPADHPTSITLMYLNIRSGFSPIFTLVDSRIINATAPPETGAIPRGLPANRVAQWRFGDETVLAYRDAFFDLHAGAIEKAMQATSPGESLSANVAMLWKMRYVGGTYELAEVAARLAGDRSGALVDRGNLRLIPALARAHQPLTAVTVRYVTDIPYTHDVPDLNRAKYSWKRDVAVTADGVRAIAAVMAAAGESGRWTDCCEILYTAPENGTYTLWTLPIKKSHRVTKYEVDAKSYRVRS